MKLLAWSPSLLELVYGPYFHKLWNSCQVGVYRYPPGGWLSSYLLLAQIISQPPGG
jgi:hypothetical protein